MQVEIEDMEWNAEKATFYFPCPCGDRFLITVVLPAPLPIIFDIEPRYK